MEKYSADNHKKRLLASRNALFLLFALPGVAFATWISRTATTRDMLAVSNAEMGWIFVRTICWFNNWFTECKPLH